MVLEVWTGVTSRIYTVSDAVAMCRETDEKLVVYWPIEGDCHIRMEDVFQIADDIEVEVHNFYHVRHYKPIDVRKSIGQSIKALMQDIPIWFYNKLIATDLEKIKEKCEYSFSFSPPREVGWGGAVNGRSILYKCIMKFCGLDKKMTLRIYTYMHIVESDMEITLNMI